jgi:cytochrome P450
LSPVLVSAGQKVVSSSHALHRLPEYWGADVEAFRPERWEKCRPGWHYQPFGGGPRMCPGQNLALTEAAYVLARMAQEWKGCECRDDVWEWIEEIRTTASGKNGVKVGLVAS